MVPLRFLLLEEQLPFVPPIMQYTAVVRVKEEPGPLPSLAKLTSQHTGFQLERYQLVQVRYFDELRIHIWDTQFLRKLLGRKVLGLYTISSDLACPPFMYQPE